MTNHLSNPKPPVPFHAIDTQLVNELYEEGRKYVKLASLYKDLATLAVVESLSLSTKLNNKQSQKLNSNYETINE